MDLSTPPEWTKARYEVLYDLLRDLVQIPSVNPGEQEVMSGLDESAVSNYVMNWFRSLPVEVSRQAVLPGRDNILIRWRASDRQGEILWCTHLDTVPVGNMAQPFAARVVDGKLYGRGACDAKGSLAAMMLAFRMLLEAQIPLPATLTLLCTVDEEYRARGVQQYVADGGRPSLAVFGEPTELTVVTAQRGDMIFHITTHGRAAHGSRPEAGRNAIERMAQVIHRMGELSTREYVKRIHPLCGRPTINIGTIEGGTAPWIVPDRCVIAVDRRWIPGEDWQAVWNEIREAALADGDEVEVEAPTWRVAAMETPAQTVVVSALSEALVQIRGVSELAGATFTSEAALVAEHDVPTVIFGPGSIMQAHADVEYVELAQVWQAAQVLTRFAPLAAAALQNELERASQHSPFGRT